jgi:hypothetical protein
MELMRPERIDTTLKYYVGRNQTTADVLWAAYEQQKPHGNNFGNTARESVERATEKPAATECHNGL